MSAIRAAASFKKEAGFITIPKERNQVMWSAASSSSTLPPVKLSVATISNLQQSPATSAKASVKIVVTLPGTAAPDNYVFTFTSPTGAKTDQEIVVDALKDLISSSKTFASNAPTPMPSTGVGTPVPAGVTTPAPAAGPLAIAQTMTNVNSAANEAFSDAALLSDDNLQRSLLQSNQSLHLRFREFLKSKPDTIPLKQFNHQFWLSRVHLLRAHAVEKRQAQGTYNVLSVVKPKRNVDGVIKLNVSKEQIQLIFQQHPLVRKVYDDLVPRRFKDHDFWGKFFVSRLFKRLKGEKVGDMDASVPELDRYLDQADADFDNAEGVITDVSSFKPARIPRFLDMEGNEQDVTGPATGGNAPHLMMRAGRRSDVTILRVLNSMSEKMLANVKPSDNADEGNGEALLDPAGTDEKKFEELRLKDLRDEERDTRVLLNVAQQHRFFASPENEIDMEKLTDAPEHVIAAMKDDIRELQRDIVTSPLTDSSDASRRRAVRATKGLLTSIKHRRSLLPSMTDSGEEATNPSGLSSAVVEAATMTSNTTIEFLSYFWAVYLSGDANRAAELANLVERLDRSLERMESVGKMADAEREEKIKEARQRNEELRKLGRRGAGAGRIREKDIKGGKEAADELLQATERAVRKAGEVYRKEWEIQTGKPYGTVIPAAGTPAPGASG